MKPHISGVLFAVLTLVGASSAVHGGALEVGGKIGFNAGGMWGEDSEGWGTRSGVCLGGVVSYEINRLFGIQGELLYSQKGARRGDPNLGETITVKADYIEVPLLAKVSRIASGSFCCVPLPGDRRTSFYLGPALGLKIASTIETGSGGSGVEEDANIKSLDAGVALGVSTGYGSGTLFVFADFRFTAGLISVYTLPNGSDVSNYAASMALGITFAREE
jgi:hypothetical protein